MPLQLLAVLAGIVACWGVGHFAVVLLRTLRPSRAVPLLAATALVAALACGMAISAIATGMMAGLSWFADRNQWSAEIVRDQILVPPALGWVAFAILVVLLGNAMAETVTIAAALVRADRMAKQLRGDHGPVVIVDGDSDDAYTVAGLRGCVVITRSLFDRMSARERQVVTLHEMAHLTKRHHLYVHAVDIAAAANPLLRPVRDAIRLGVERWADEDAATQLGDRTSTGRALCHVAMLRTETVGTPSATPSRHLGVATLKVASRVQALMVPQEDRKSMVSTLTLLLALLIFASGVCSLLNVYLAVETSEAWWETFVG